MITCPICEHSMIWQSDFTCEEVFGCQCEEGIVSFHICSNCDARIQLTTNCQDEDQY